VNLLEIVEMSLFSVVLQAEASFTSVERVASYARLPRDGYHSRLDTTPSLSSGDGDLASDAGKKQVRLSCVLLGVWN